MILLLTLGSVDLRKSLTLKIEQNLRKTLGLQFAVQQGSLQEGMFWPRRPRFSLFVAIINN